MTIDSQTLAKDQAILFSQYAVIISSHSSQLVNTIFSQPNSFIIEVLFFFFLS